jgi:predicted metalloenzyme YecM
MDLTPQGIAEPLQAYALSLQEFIQEHNLPAEWFAITDHIALKCADAAQFETTAQAWLPLAKQASYVVLNNRRLASFELKEPIAIGALGAVQWLEVMEPRPERAGSDFVGLEHSEFLFPDFAAAEQVLESRDVTYTPQSNPSHRWLNIVINPVGQELKLNSRLLAETVAANIRDGEARYFA